MRKITCVNASERSWTKGSFVLWFGSFAPIFLLIYANGLEDALEIAGDWLVDNAPGHIIQHGSEEHIDLLKEAFREYGVEFDLNRLRGIIEPPYDGILELAESDLTYTESGYITSYEWGIVMENPTRQQLVSFVHD